MNILNEVSVDVSPKDMGAYHRVGGLKNKSKKTIVRFINRKFAKKALISRQNLRKSLSSNCKVFINENLTVRNNKIAFLSRKLKCSGHLTKICQETEQCIFQLQKYYIEENY